MRLYTIMQDYTALYRIIKIMPDYRALCRITMILPDYTILCRIIYHYAGLQSFMPDYKDYA